MSGANWQMACCKKFQILKFEKNLLKLQYIQLRVHSVKLGEIMGQWCPYIRHWYFETGPFWSKPNCVHWNGFEIPINPMLRSRVRSPVDITEHKLWSLNSYMQSSDIFCRLCGQYMVTGPWLDWKQQRTLSIGWIEISGLEFYLRFLP